MNKKGAKSKTKKKSSASKGVQSEQKKPALRPAGTRSAQSPRPKRKQYSRTSSILQGSAYGKDYPERD